MVTVKDLKILATNTVIARMFDAKIKSVKIGLATAPKTRRRFLMIRLGKQQMYAVLKRLVLNIILDLLRVVMI